MLASEVSCVKPLQKLGKLFTVASFWEIVHHKLQKLICPGKKVSEQEIVQQQEISLKINLVQIANAMQC